MNDLNNSDNASSEKNAGGIFFKETHLMSEADMDAACIDMAKKIVSEFGASDDIVLIGIKTRGVPLADWIAKHINKLRGSTVKVGAIDINLYRDDLSEVDEQPVVRLAGRRTVQRHPGDDAFRYRCVLFVHDAVAVNVRYGIGEDLLYLYLLTAVLGPAYAPELYEMRASA